ncbi:MAG: tetratricopeptide repeat protein [Marinifilaceae bacterium]
MKRAFLMTAVSVFTLSFFISGCTSMKKLEKGALSTAVQGNVVPSYLEAIDGVVNFDYMINFAPKQFPKKMVMKVTPRMQYGNQSVALQPIMFQGQKIKNSDYPVVAWKANTEFAEKMQMQYKNGMQNGVLWADIETMDKRGNKLVDLEPVILNDKGVRNWERYSYTIDGVTYVPVYTDDVMIKDVAVTELGVLSGYVMFPLGSSVITAQQMKTPEMLTAEKNMKAILANKDAKVQNMMLYVSSSPEGPERLNTNLTKNRFNTAKKCFDNVLGLNKAGLTKNKNFIVSKLVDENWTGLYDLISVSNIAAKTQMVADLKAAKNNAAREKVLEGYIKKYPEVKNVILPQLRRADYFVFFTVPTTVDENVDYTFYVPQTETNVNPTIYQDWKMLNNMAAIAIRKKEYHKAKKLLEAAAQLSQEAHVMNNLAVTYAQTGELAKGVDLLSKYADKSEAKYNLGLMLMQQGQYKKAAHYLKEKPSVYLAYSQLMAAENQGALETFQAVTLDNGMEYYMMAVAAARNNQPQVLVTALAKAIQLNPALKKMAQTDVEFYPYKDNANYQQVVK